MSVDNEEILDDGGDAPAKVGRPAYEPNEYDEGQLAALLAVGFPHRQISLYMKKDMKTLRKHYPELFETNLNKEDKTNMVENSLWYNAVYRHNVVAQLAWLKAHKKELYSEKAQEKQTNESDPNALFAELAKNLPN